MGIDREFLDAIYSEPMWENVWEYESGNFKEVVEKKGNIKHIKQYLNNCLQREAWYRDEKLHRDDGPALIEYYPSGKIYSEKWYQNGVLRKEISYWSNGSKKQEVWYNETGQLHRDDGPAVVMYSQNAAKIYEEWRKNGLIWKEDGPAVIEYFESGEKASESWFNEKSRLHRSKAPAHIKYEKDGAVNQEEYYENGLLHRLDGPAVRKKVTAVIETENSKEVFSFYEEKYYINGQQVEKEDLEKYRHIKSQIFGAKKSKKIKL